MRRALTLAVFALSLFSFPALPQQAPTTGSIEGIVIRADTEQPIANVQVTLTRTYGSPIPPVGPDSGGTVVTTGADGKFAFRDLTPDTYSVAAAATGFVRQEFGQRALNGPGRRLFVVAGQAFNDANIRMTPTGTISGRIFDENGQPATGAPVQLIGAVYSAQGKTYQRVNGVPSDDRGNYRIFGVPPGHYYLMAGAPPSLIDLSIGQRGAAARPVRFSVMSYPSVSQLDQATTIEVKAGGESSFDMHLKRETRTFHVRGRVINASGEPLPQDLIMMLGYRNPAGGAGSANVPNSFDPATSTFDLARVPPGEFTLLVARSLQPPAGERGAGPVRALAEQRAMGPAASTPISVTDSDIGGLVLTLTAAGTMKGKLIVEGQPISAVPNLNQLRLNIRNVLPPVGQGMPTSSTIAADGTFQVTGLREDEYRAQLSANVPGFYVKSIKYGAEDILGKAFKIGAGSSGAVEVILKAGTQTISGTVTDSKSQPVPGIAVVLIPAQRGALELFRNANTDKTGKFTVTDLPPGEYKVFSWEAADYNAYMDPDFLTQYEQLGRAVSVRENATSSVDVKLIPAQ